MQKLRKNRSLIITIRDVKIEVHDYPLGVSLIFGFGFGFGMGVYAALEHFVLGAE